MAELLKGAPVARALALALREESDALRARGVTPCLATVRVGEKDADLAYERGIGKRCEQAGVAVQRIAFPADVSQETLLRELSALGANPGVHGILLLRPLADRFDDAAVCAAVPPGSRTPRSSTRRSCRSAWWRRRTLLRVSGLWSPRTPRRTTRSRSSSGSESSSSCSSGSP